MRARSPRVPLAVAGSTAQFSFCTLVGTGGSRLASAGLWSLSVEVLQEEGKGATTATATSGVRRDTPASRSLGAAGPRRALLIGPRGVRTAAKRRQGTEQRVTGLWSRAASATHHALSAHQHTDPYGEYLA